MHPTQHTSPVSVDLQLQLVSGWGLLKRRSTPPYGPLWLEKDFSLVLVMTFITKFLVQFGSSCWYAVFHLAYMIQLSLL